MKSDDPVDQDPTVLAEVTEQLLLNMIQAQSTMENHANALRQMAQHAQIDSLTQLPNRVLFLDRCAQAIAHAHRHRGRLALLFVDIDRFKEINDRLGHLAGDRALRSAARRLLRAVREVDTVSRFGGDEFIVLISEIAVPDDATVIVKKILAALMKGDSEGLGLMASIGISVYPEDGVDTEVLIARADAAMYDAKAAGGGTWARFGEIAAPPGAPRSTSPTWNPAGESLAVPLRRDARRIGEGSYSLRFRVSGSDASGAELDDGRDATAPPSGRRFSGDLRVSGGRATANVVVRIAERGPEGSMIEMDFAVQMTSVVDASGFSLRGVGPRGLMIEIDCSDHQDPAGNEG